MSFETLNLDSRLLKALASCKFDQPTDIQREAIPVVLAGKDLMASAQTGTGKTAAFVLPLLQKLIESKPTGHGPAVLILTPTRELAAQVENNIRQLGKNMRLNSVTLVGGESYIKQNRMLQRPLDIIVATPGRLMDHIERRRIDLSGLQYLVLDEADRMLDMGFIDDVKYIASLTPENKQTLLFSATLEGRIIQIANALLKSPVKIQLTRNSDNHASISQRLFFADDVGHKHRLLDHFLANEGVKQAVIFTATKVAADSLSQDLIEKGHAAAALHGDISQHHRQKTVERLRRGKVQLLVATDVAARGLDVAGISHVFNFDLPMTPEDYIHRIGRTGRGGATGSAISFAGPADRRKLQGIERLIGRRMHSEQVAGLEPRKRLADAKPKGKKRFDSRNKPNRRGNAVVSYKPAQKSRNQPRQGA